MESPVDAIRERYPTPMTSGQASYGKDYKDRYCVMGALGLFRGHLTHFPFASLGAMCLGGMNENLPTDIAVDYSLRVIRLNDTGNFEAAWSLLNEALLYGR